MGKLFANDGDPDQTQHSAASDLGLHCLPIILIGVSRLQWEKCSPNERERKHFDRFASPECAATPLSFESLLYRLYSGSLLYRLYSGSLSVRCHTCCVLFIDFSVRIYYTILYNQSFNDNLSYKLSKVL